MSDQLQQLIAGIARRLGQEQVQDRVGQRPLDFGFKDETTVTADPRNAPKITDEEFMRLRFGDRNNLPQGQHYVPNPDSGVRILPEWRRQFPDAAQTADQAWKRLAARYPGATSQATIRFDPNMGPFTRGSYQPGDNSIYLNPQFTISPDTTENTITHELMHLLESRNSPPDSVPGQNILNKDRQLPYEDRYAERLAAVPAAIHRRTLQNEFYDRAAQRAAKKGQK